LVVFGFLGGGPRGPTEEGGPTLLFLIIWGGVLWNLTHKGWAVCSKTVQGVFLGDVTVRDEGVSLKGRARGELVV
jgi:hypothetical protein